MANERMKGYIDAIVLSLLAAGDSYGYDITKRVNEETNGALHLKEGTLYPSLKRMASEGWIEGYWDMEDHSGPRRRYYRITESGRHALAEIRREWQQQQSILKVFLGEV